MKLTLLQQYKKPLLFLFYIKVIGLIVFSFTLMSCSATFRVGFDKATGLDIRPVECPESEDISKEVVEVPSDNKEGVQVLFEDKE